MAISWLLARFGDCPKDAAMPASRCVVLAAVEHGGQPGVGGKVGRGALGPSLARCSNSRSRRMRAPTELPEPRRRKSARSPRQPLPGRDRVRSRDPHPLPRPAGGAAPGGRSPSRGRVRTPRLGQGLAAQTQLVAPGSPRESGCQGGRRGAPWRTAERWMWARGLSERDASSSTRPSRTPPSSAEAQDRRCPSAPRT